MPEVNNMWQRINFWINWHFRWTNTERIYYSISIIGKAYSLPNGKIINPYKIEKAI